MTVWGCQLRLSSVSLEESLLQRGGVCVCVCACMCTCVHVCTYVWGRSIFYAKELSVWWSLSEPQIKTYNVFFFPDTNLCFFKNPLVMGLSGGPVVKTPCSQCGVGGEALGSIPDQQTRLCMVQLKILCATTKTRSSQINKIIIII